MKVQVILASVNIAVKQGYYFVKGRWIQNYPHRK